jgi:hypothetical protein
LSRKHERPREVRRGTGVSPRGCAAGGRGSAERGEPCRGNRHSAWPVWCLGPWNSSTRCQSGAQGVPPFPSAHKRHMRGAERWCSVRSGRRVGMLVDQSAWPVLCLRPCPAVSGLSTPPSATSLVPKPCGGTPALCRSSLVSRKNEMPGRYDGALEFHREAVPLKVVAVQKRVSRVGVIVIQRGQFGASGRGTPALFASLSTLCQSGAQGVPPFASAHKRHMCGTERCRSVGSEDARRSVSVACSLPPAVPRRVRAPVAAKRDQSGAQALRWYSSALP